MNIIKPVYKLLKPKMHTRFSKEVQKRCKWKSLVWGVLFKQCYMENGREGKERELNTLFGYPVV